MNYIFLLCALSFSQSGFSQTPAVPSFSTQKFESQVADTLRQISRQAKTLPGIVPHPQAWTHVEMRIDDWITITEPSLNIHVTGFRSFNEISFNGDLQGIATPIFARPNYGYILRGAGVNAEVRRSGFDGDYVVNGSFTDNNGPAPIHLTLAQVALAEFRIRQTGVDLTIKPDTFGGRDRFIIKGKVDTAVLGKRGLAVLGTCVASLAFPPKNFPLESAWVIPHLTPVPIPPWGHHPATP
ncbi:MAG: hypothetical protein HY399_03915 [Elusimicrobia bacterium]|nr:hypothetical protein [Elusimicrobiota bacterium]